jgi:hypothetical protein
MATASSGFTPLFGALPKNAFTESCTLGIRVIPPTNNTSSTLSLLNPESFKHYSKGLSALSTRFDAKFSNFSRVMLSYKCLGPV